MQTRKIAAKSESIGATNLYWELAANSCNELTMGLNFTTVRCDVKKFVNMISATLIIKIQTPRTSRTTNRAVYGKVK